jgi:hypothetical protein
VTMAERRGQRLQIGRVVVQTFHALRHNSFVLLALSPVVAIPDAVLRYQATLVPDDDMLGVALLLPFGAVIVSSYLLCAAISLALVHDSAGRLPSLGRVTTAVAKDFFPLVALAITASFVSALANLALTTYEFGFILLIPALAIETLLAVITPVRMIEQRPIMATIARSIELTAGNRWPILLLLLVSIALMIAAEIIVYGTIGDAALAEFTGRGLLALVSLIVADIAITIVGSVATVMAISNCG